MSEKPIVIVVHASFGRCTRGRLRNPLVLVADSTAAISGLTAALRVD